MFNQHNQGNNQGSLDQLIDYAKEALVEKRSNRSGSGGPKESATDAILFLGNRQETVPRRLLIDDRLGSTEKIGWQMIQLLAKDISRIAFPTYEELRPLLRSRAGESASKATVSRVIAILRLTRWLSLGSRVRDPRSGFVLGNVYLLHDEPLTAGECNQVDPTYFDYVLKSLNHQNKSIVAAAESVVDDVLTSGMKIPSRLETVLNRMGAFTEFSERTQSENNDLGLSSPRELSELPERTKLSSPGELSRKTTTYNRVLRENSVSTVSSKVSNVSTTDSKCDSQGLFWHPVFSSLTEVVYQTFARRVELLPIKVKQDVIDECAGRLLLDSIKKPGSYLASITMRAMTQQFHLSDFGKHVKSLRSEPSPDTNSVEPERPSGDESKRQKRRSITDSIMDINDTDW